MSGAISPLPHASTRLTFTGEYFFWSVIKEVHVLNTCHLFAVYVV